jgi:hypothetical protein
VTLAPAATFLDRVRSMGAVAANYVRPPYEGDVRAIFADIEGVHLPDDLVALWQTFDGCEQHQATLGEQWLDGVFVYLGAEAAREDYAISEPMWAEDPSFADYMPQRFIAVATPGDGSRLMVNCDAASPTHGAVYELFHGVGLSKRSFSLARHFETLNAMLNEGSLTCDAGGMMQMDFDAARPVGKAMNPGCNHWDNTLPTCYDAPDWRPKDYSI